MNKKIVGILVMTLLITTALPVVGTIVKTTYIKEKAETIIFSEPIIQEADDLSLRLNAQKYPIGDSNEAYLGETWTINDADMRTGAANLDTKDIDVTWSVDPDEVARGFVKLGYNSLIYDETGKVLSQKNKDRVCSVGFLGFTSTYSIIVYDGDSTSDPILLEDYVPVTDEGGIVIDELESPLDVDTEGLSSRTLAYEVIVETQKYHKIFKFPISSVAGNKAREGRIKIDFERSAVSGIEKPVDVPPAKTAINNVDFRVGDIEVWSPDEVARIPKARVSMNPIQEIIVNLSEDVQINATANWTVDLTVLPRPWRIIPLPWLCEITFTLSASSKDSYGDGHLLAPPESQSHICMKDTLKADGTLSLSFTVNTEEYPSSVKFVLSCDMHVHPTWHILRTPPVQGEDRSHASGLNYIFWMFA